MRVLKFGGSSVGSPDAIKQVIEILTGYHNNSINFSVIFSAFKGVTNLLQKMAADAEKNELGYLIDYNTLYKQHRDVIKELIGENNQGFFHEKLEFHFKELKDILNGVYLLGELTPKASDRITGFGEIFSCIIISEALKYNGLDCEFVDSREIIRTDNHFGHARVDFKTTNKLVRKKFADETKIRVVTGFIASSPEGYTTTLGRGGSDYTASIIGAAVEAEAIEIWTDVDGILSADPRKVENAIPIDKVTYEEAMELSHFGAKVIFPPTMQPTREKKIKLVIKNTFNPGFEGTEIVNAHTGTDFRIKGVSSIDGINLLRITGSGMVGVPGIASRVFGALARHSINVILITQGSSEHSICLAVSPSDGKDAKKFIEEEFRYEIRDKIIDGVLLEKDLSIVAVVAENFRKTPGVAGRIFGVLGENNVNIVTIAQGSSELNISLVINKKDLSKALNTLHNKLFLLGSERK